MLALKKKRLAEAKAKEAAEAAEAAGISTSETAASEPSAAPAPAGTTKKVSLLGIGGKKKSNGENGKGSGKRRTPGEIRIQKGEFGKFCSFGRRTFEFLLSI